MPMKLKYKLKLLRPKSKSVLTGKRVLKGDCYVDENEDGYTFLKNGAKKGEVLMYWSPSAMYAHHSGKVPRSILNHVTIMANIHTMEVCYTRHNTDTHPSLFMLFSADRDVCNVEMTSTSAIIALHDINSSDTVKLTCYYNNWSPLNETLQSYFPTRFMKLKKDLDIDYLQSMNKKKETVSEIKQSVSDEESGIQESSISNNNEDESDLLLDDIDIKYRDLWYLDFKEEYNSFLFDMDED